MSGAGGFAGAQIALALERARLQRKENEHHARCLVKKTTSRNWPPKDKDADGEDQEDGGVGKRLGRAPPAAQPLAKLAEQPIVFAAESGESVDAYQSAFVVRENRSDPASQTLTLSNVRFPATGENPGAPIVYLAGGPGGSGAATAKGRRFPLFMAMREFGDVIAFDQRGTGLSADTPPCQSSVIIPDDVRLPREGMFALLKQSARECDGFWKSERIDLRGYTTLESARDLDALRAHLGAEKLSLWGISYGTHLALTAVREMGPRLDRLVLASAEGLDQTVKLPSQTDAYFARIQAAINKDERARAAYPDVKALMRGVHAKLDAAPVMVQTQTGKGPADLLLHGDMMRIMASAMIADPESVGSLLQLCSAAEAGFYEPTGQLLARFMAPGEPQNWRAMPLAMDVASGITPQRLARVDRAAEGALLGDVLNFPMPHLNGAIEGLDLGDDFRSGPRGAMPALLLMGTLDGRTYPDEQRQAVRGLSNLSVVRPSKTPGTIPS